VDASGRESLDQSCFDGGAGSKPDCDTVCIQATCDESSNSTSSDTTTSNDYEWGYGPWSTCDVTCGSGTQSRRVVCIAPDYAIANDDNCDASTQPDSSVSCTMATCTSTSVHVERRYSIHRGNVKRSSLSSEAGGKFFKSRARFFRGD
jgi:hypothetical protein